MEQTNRAAKINRTTRCVVCYAALLLLTLALGAAGLRFGSVKITAQEIISALVGEKSTAADIIMISRLPRVIAATVLGGALAVSGYLLQTFFANPIAGPFVLGISSGAKLTRCTGDDSFPGKRHDAGFRQGLSSRRLSARCFHWG